MLRVRVEPAADAPLLLAGPSSFPGVVVDTMARSASRCTSTSWPSSRFSFSVLVARATSLLRKVGDADPVSLVFGDLRLAPAGGARLEVRLPR
ncbi:hypothetical protein B7486_60010 [cyanobacterium TDX16]|nr:hypothetical protein B7486_60010 [cyanobacterium TDX16]